MENYKSEENQLFFSDVYIEQILREIRNIFEKKITVQSNRDCLNLCRNPFEKADKEMRRVLKGLLYPNNNDIYNGKVFDNNFLALQEGDTVAARKKLRCSLVLYYTALYFDNVDLLVKLIQENVYFGEEPDSLRLHYLDRSVSNLFNHEKYAETIKRASGFFGQCYQSVSRENYSKRREYLAKFARIIEKRKDLSYQNDRGEFLNSHPSLISKNYKKEAKDYYNDRNIFTKDTLDIFDEETYMKASTDQLKIVFGNVRGGFRDSKNISRLNRLVVDKGYCNPSVWFGECLFDLFDDDELLKLSYKAAENFYCAYRECTDLERVKNLWRQKPILGEYSVIFSNSFLSMLTDKEILSLTPENLDGIYSICFPNDLSRLDYERAKKSLKNAGVYSQLAEIQRENQKQAIIEQRNKQKQIGVKKKVKAFLGMD